MSELAMKVIKWQTKDRVGISSATMAAVALGLDKNFYSDYSCHRVTLLTYADACFFSMKYQRYVTTSQLLPKRCQRSRRLSTTGMN